MNDTGWGNYCLAIFFLLTWPLWKPEDRDMQAVAGWRPIDRELGACPTTEHIHAKRLEAFRKQHGEAA